VSNRSGTSRSDKQSGADVVELVPTSTIDRTERSRKEDSRSSAGYRSVRLARQQQKQSVDSLPGQGSGDSPAGPAILCEGADRFLVTDSNPSRQRQDDRTGRDKEAIKESYDSNAGLTAPHQPAGFLPETETMANAPSLPVASLGPAYQAAQCYQIFQICTGRGGALLETSEDRRLDEPAVGRRMQGVPEPSQTENDPV